MDVVSTHLDEKLEDCKNQISERISEVDNLIKKIDYYQQELRELGRDTHDWEEIREKVAYPTAKPDETRVIEKTTRKRCKKCYIERSV
ncbi:MAG: hypothetical protein FGF51_04355 [Candidatus Brockarchaeota archaeon]|nr:hypothetical protein [Candidatus Brockarchaeota archaeon]